MSERKITIKPYRGGSLGLRVFFISFLLLVLPLFFHAFFLYKKEYVQQIEDVRLTLKIIGEGQRALLEEKIQMQWHVLDSVEFGKTLLKEKFHIFEAPSLENREDIFALVSKDQQFLWVVKKGSQKKMNVIATPLSEIFYSLIHFEDAPYSIALALVGEDQQMIAGKKFDSALTFHFPIEGASFSLLLTAEESSIKDLHWRYYLVRFASLVFFIGVVGGIFVWAFVRRVSRPLRDLCATMDRVGEGAVHLRYKGDWMGFEINRLGLRFNQTLDRLLYHMEETEKEKLRRQLLAEELRLGHEIQLSLLPSHLPEIKGLELGTGFFPAREVSGDFYDVFPLANGSLFFVMADTAGKGVSACLYSLGLRSILRSLSTLTQDLSEIILRANDLFMQDAKNSGVFITVWAAIYDPIKSTLSYCSQGHPPAILLKKETLEELWTAGICLGAQTFDVVDIKKVNLEPQDLLVLYTDGVIENHDEDRELFGKKRLFEFLIRSKQLPSTEIIEKLNQELALFRQGAVQQDDIAMMIWKLNSISMKT